MRHGMLHQAVYTEHLPLMSMTPRVPHYTSPAPTPALTTETRAWEPSSYVATARTVATEGNDPMHQGLAPSGQWLLSGHSFIWEEIKT